MRNLKLFALALFSLIGSSATKAQDAADLPDASVLTLQWNGGGRYSGINGGIWSSDFGSPNGGNGKLGIVKVAEGRYAIASQGVYFRIDNGQKAEGTKETATGFEVTGSIADGLTFYDPETGYYLNGSQFNLTTTKPEQNYKVNTYNVANQFYAKASEDLTAVGGVWMAAVCLPYKVQKPEGEGYHTYVVKADGTTEDVDVVEAGQPFIYVTPTNEDNQKRLLIPQQEQAYADPATDGILRGYFLARDNGDGKGNFYFGVKNGVAGFYSDVAPGNVVDRAYLPASAEIVCATITADGEFTLVPPFTGRVEAEDGEFATPFGTPEDFGLRTDNSKVGVDNTPVTQIVWDNAGFRQITGTWKITVPEGQAGTYNVTIMHGTKDGNYRYLYFQANDNITQSLYPTTWAGGSWDLKGKFEFQTNLKEGENTITMSAHDRYFAGLVTQTRGAYAAPPIDYIEFKKASTDSNMETGFTSEPVEVGTIEAGASATYSVNVPSDGVYMIDFVYQGGDNEFTIKANTQPYLPVQIGNSGESPASRKILLELTKGDNEILIKAGAAITLTSFTATKVKTENYEYETLKSPEFTSLLDEITASQAAIDGAKYEDGKEDLQAAIEKAQAAIDDPEGNTESWTAAQAELQAARENFESIQAAKDAESATTEIGEDGTAVVEAETGLIPDGANATKDATKDAELNDAVKLSFDGSAANNYGITYYVNVPEGKAGTYDVQALHSSMNNRFITIQANDDIRQAIAISTAASDWGICDGTINFQVNLKEGQNVIVLRGMWQYAKGAEQPNESYAPGIDKFLFSKAETDVEFETAYVSDILPAGDFVAGTGSRETRNFAYTGLGFDGDRWADYKVTAPSMGAYLVEFTYATMQNRDFAITVNSDARTVVPCSAGGSWNDADRRRQILIWLNEGENAIHLDGNNTNSPIIEAFTFTKVQTVNFTVKYYSDLFAEELAKAQALLDNATKEYGKEALQSAINNAWVDDEAQPNDPAFLAEIEKLKAAEEIFIQGQLQVHAEDEFENTKVYTLVTKRAAWALNEEATKLATSDEPVETFAVLEIEGKLYIYSPSQKKFLNRNGNDAELFGGKPHAFNFLPQNDGTLVAKHADEPYYVNINGAKNVYFDGWDTPDDGNKLIIMPAGDFSEADYLEALNVFGASCTITFDVVFNGNVIATKAVEGIKGEAIPAVPAELQHEYVTLTPDVEEGTIVEEPITVTLTAEWNGPFNFSTTADDATWYNMTIRTQYYVAVDETEPYYPKAVNDPKTLQEDKYKWAFTGDPYNVVVVNKTQGFAQSLHNEGGNVVLRDGDYAWDIFKNGNGFVLREQGSANNYINQEGGGSGKLGFWNSGNGRTDDGSTFRVTEAFETSEEQYAAAEALQTIPGLMAKFNIVSDASMYSSNAVEPTEGSLANLLDGDLGNFFHSLWSSTGPDEDHYLQASLKDAIDGFVFIYHKREDNNNNRPTSITIGSGPEATEVTTINSGLPVDNNDPWYTSSLISLDEASDIIRFTVTATNNAAANNGHVFFTFAEFYILEAKESVINGSNVYSNLHTKAPGELTDQDIADIYAAIKALEEDTPTGLNGVDAETLQNESIYDLTGRKVLKATKGGIYIINGKKVVVK